MQDFKDRNILITAGPTIEDIDPVRFISNRSSGKMGLALAEQAHKRGAKVTLILGPVTISTPDYFNIVNVRSAKEMCQLVLDHFPGCDIFIAAAAVADFTPARVSKQKIKKGNDNFILELVRTKDILKEIRAIKSAKQKVVGFSVETEKLVENSKNKLVNKNLDMIVANNPRIEGAAFAGDTNQVEIITRTQHISLPLMSKTETADKILDQILLLEQ